MCFLTKQSPKIVEEIVAEESSGRRRKLNDYSRRTVGIKWSDSSSLIWLVTNRC